MPRDIDEVNNPVIDELDDELAFINKQKPAHMEKVKLDKGESVLIRFFPYKFDEKGTWFLRYGHHWVGNRTYLCARATSQAHGGSPNADCPFCSLSETYSKKSNLAVQIAAKGLAYDFNYLLFAFLWERFIGSENIRYDAPKCYTLNEFHAPRAIFEQLIKDYKRKHRANNTLSFLDPQLGNDFLFSREKKYAIQIEEASAWAKTESEIETIWEAATNSIIPPRLTFLSGDKLNEVYAEAKNNVSNGIITNKYDKLWYDKQQEKARSTVPATRPQAEDQDAHGFEEREDEPERQAPAPARQSESIPKRRPISPAPEAQRPQPKPAVDQPSRNTSHQPQPQHHAEDEQEGNFDEDQAPTTEAPAKPKSQAAPVTHLTPPARRQVPVNPPAPAPKSESYAIPGDDEDEGEEGLPTEHVDPAPPVKQEVDDAPPKVAATGTPANAPLKGNILDRLRRNNQAVKPS